MSGGMVGAAGGVVALEFCIPLLLLCWFCCWNDPGSETSSNEGKQPKKPVIVTESPRRRRPSDLFRRRAGTGNSVNSLHLPCTSGTKPSLSGHRSHEELRPYSSPNDARYHSAPSVIHQVVHRRDWDRHTLYTRNDDITIIPLHDHPQSSVDIRDQNLQKTCKKHHTNIKSTKTKPQKEDTRNFDIKDFAETSFTTSDQIQKQETEMTETEMEETEMTEIEEINNDIVLLDSAKFKIKEVKQSYNESIKKRNSLKIKRNSNTSAISPKIEQIGDVDPSTIDGTTEANIKVPNVDPSTIDGASRANVQVPNVDPSTIDGANEAYVKVQINADISIESALDRSGAIHHGSRDSLMVGTPRTDCSRASVEAVSYDAARCYLREDAGVSAGGAGGTGRGRLASDGDILDTTPRPHSTAFSESDVDIELEISSCIVPPPPYFSVSEGESNIGVEHAITRRKETAI